MQRGCGAVCALASIVAAPRMGTGCAQSAAGRHWKACAHATRHRWASCRAARNAKAPEAGFKLSNFRGVSSHVPRTFFMPGVEMTRRQHPCLRSFGDRPTVCGEFGHPDDGIANRAVVARPNDRDVVSNTAAAERRVAASGDERFKVAFLMFPCCHRAGAGSRRLSKLPGRAPDRFFRRAGPVRFQRNLDAPPHGIHSAEIVNFISACSSRVISPRA
jgi:hypothetical protein